MKNSEIIKEIEEKYIIRTNEIGNTRNYCP